MKKWNLSENAFVKNYQNFIRTIIFGILLIYAIAFSEGDMKVVFFFGFIGFILMLVCYMLSRDEGLEIAWNPFCLDLVNILAIIYVGYETGLSFGAWRAIPVVIVYSAVSFMVYPKNITLPAALTVGILIFTYIVGGETEERISRNNLYCLLLDCPEEIITFPYQVELEAWKDYKKSFPDIQNPYQLVTIKKDWLHIIDVTSPNFRPHWWSYPLVIQPLGQARMAMEEYIRKNGAKRAAPE